MKFIELKKELENKVCPAYLISGNDRFLCYSALDLIKKAANNKSGSKVPNKDKVAKLTKDQVRSIAETKMSDLNANSIEAAMSMVAGTARSMGITVEE